MQRYLESVFDYNIGFKSFGIKMFNEITFTASFFNNYKPKTLIVGDSFMGQMVDAMEQANVYSRPILSHYFQTHVIHHPDPSLPVPPANSKEQIQKEVMKDALLSDLIILQMVDYNINRYGYGFVEALTNYIKQDEFAKK